MANEKISQLASGGSLQNSDLLVIARGGNNYKIAGSQVVTPSALESYVPYTGATGPVYLGNNSLLASGVYLYQTDPEKTNTVLHAYIGDSLEIGRINFQKGTGSDGSASLLVSAADGNLTTIFDANYQGLDLSVPLITPAYGLRTKDTGNSGNSLVLVSNETLSATRNLNFVVNDSSRIINLLGNLTISGGEGNTLNFITTDDSADITVPSGADTMALLNASQTFTNKIAIDNSFYFANWFDLSKRATFACDSISTGTYRVFAFQDQDGNLALLENTLNQFATTSASALGAKLSGGADGQLFIGKTDGTFVPATLTEGSNVTITNGNGSITIAASITSATWVASEALTGTLDGSNTVFTLSNTPIINSQTIYINGLMQDIGDDYTISGNTVTFVIAPLAGSRPVANYQYGGTPSATWVASEVPSGAVDGSNTNFIMAHTPISGSQAVYLNGLLQTEITDYTLSASTITFVTAPTSGSQVVVNYQY